MNVVVCEHSFVPLKLWTPLAVLILNLYTVRVLLSNTRFVAFLSFQMEEDKGSVSSAYEFAESKRRGEDSGHLLAEACSQQGSSCVHSVVLRWTFWGRICWVLVGGVLRHNCLAFHFLLDWCLHCFSYVAFVHSFPFCDLYFFYVSILNLLFIFLWSYSANHTSSQILI